MPFEVTVDTRAVDAAIRKIPAQAARGVGTGMRIFGTETVRDFTKKRLSAADDRVSIPELGGLGIRPAGSRGLVRRSGELARSFISTTKGSSLDDLITQIGFLSPFAARRARMHELGTIGKGGTLPDIVPRTGRYLVVPVRGLNAALGQARGVVMLKRVSIPPRLGFYPYAAQRLKSGRLEKAVAEGVQREIDRGAA